MRTTSTVLVSSTPRRLARISRSEEVIASQYSSAGRKTRSMSSGGRWICRSAGDEPEGDPQEQEQDGYRDAQAAPEDPADDDRRAQQDDEL